MTQEQNTPLETWMVDGILSQDIVATFASQLLSFSDSAKFPSYKLSVADEIFLLDLKLVISEGRWMKRPEWEPALDSQRLARVWKEFFNYLVTNVNELPGGK